jgi:HEAT repeat protein
MVQALAPRLSRGCSRVILSIALAGLWPCALAAQAPDTKKDAAPAKKDAAPAKKDAGKAAPKDAPVDEAAEPDPGTIIDPSKAEKTERVQTFKDPRADAILEVDKFKQLPPVRSSTTLQQMLDMAAGTTAIDRQAIQQWVIAQAANLTNHNSLTALINPGPAVKAGASITKAIDQASQALIEPLTASKEGSQFRQLYSKALIDTLPKILDNHLHARTEAMVVLGLTGDPDAMPHFTAQLKDPEQVMIVKLWAARGITNVAQGGRVKVETGRANAAAKALSDFLERESDTAWPVKVRALEALGSLRQASDTVAPGQAEMASTALKFLADPSANLDVRSWAAWALGMMNVPAAISKYNYALVAYHTGQIAADLGEQIGAAFGQDGKTTKLDEARRLTGLLIYQVLTALKGDDVARDSGLANSQNLGGSRSAVIETASRVQAVAQAAYNLVSPTTVERDRPKLKTVLATRVGELRQSLSKNTPTDLRLVPGGSEYPGPKTQVAAGARK